MIKYFFSLITRYQSSGILLDTNLLLLYLIGRFDQNRIVRFKRTQKFDNKDYQLLLRIKQYFKSIGTLPHVLAEVNSLSGQLPREILPTFREIFQSEISLFFEAHPPSISAAQRSEFYYLGLTDSAIIHESLGKWLVITDDFPLYNALAKAGVDVLNFTTIRFLPGL